MEARLRKGTVTHPTSPLPWLQTRCKPRLPPQAQVSLQGPHFPGSLPPLETNLGPTRRAEGHPIPSLALSAVPRPWPGDGRGATDPFRRGPGPYTHHPPAESLLLLLLLLPPPLPGATTAAPPPTSLARTAEDQSNRTGRGPAPLSQSAQARQGARPLRRRAPREAGGGGWPVETWEW